MLQKSLLFPFQREGNKGLGKLMWQISKCRAETWMLVWLGQSLCFFYFLLSLSKHVFFFLSPSSSTYLFLNVASQSSILRLHLNVPEQAEPVPCLNTTCKPQNLQSLYFIPTQPELQSICTDAYRTSPNKYTTCT